jgi:putative FmdB family regulatory protein
MPIYEYRCTECGHQTEVLQKISEPPLTVCSVCGKPSMTKLLSAAGFQLKGSGWYATDFKSASRKPESKADAKADSKPDAKADSKSDAKPEAKPETKSESKAAA